MTKSNDMYPELWFTPEQLFLSKEEASEAAQRIFLQTLPANKLTNRDLAFIQRHLLIAVDLSEKAAFLFDIYSSFFQGASSNSLKKIVRSLAMKTGKRWFSNILDDTPKISLIGVTGVRQSFASTEWKLRIAMADERELTNYLI